MRHFYGGGDEERSLRGYDKQIFVKLVAFLSPYRRLIALALLFLMITTALDLTIPYLTKEAIDRKIVLSWAKVEFTGKNPVLEKEVWEKAGKYLIGLKGSEYLLNLRKLKRSERNLLERAGILSKDRFWGMEKEKIRGLLKGIIDRHPEIFRETEGYYFAREKDFKNLSFKELIVLRAQDLKGLKLIALLFLLVILLNLLFNFGQVYTLNYTGQKAMHDMRMTVFSHLLKLPVKYFDKNPVGRLVTRATNDIQAVNEMYTSVLVFLVKDVFLLIGILAIMFKLNAKLTGMVVFLTPIIFLIAWKFQKKAREAYREVRRELARLNAFLQESLSGIKVIHLFTEEAGMFSRFKAINHAYFNANIRQILVFAVFRPLIEVIAALAVALVLWYGGGEIIRQNLSFGALVAILSYLEMLFQPIRDLAEKYNILQSAMAAGERIFGVLSEKPEPGGKVRLDEIRGEIIFDHVWFAYENEEWVLKDLSFKVNPGETVALVGPTGAGKTSITNLLLRFYDYQKGAIKIDGVELREIDPESLRRAMAIVQQDFFLFSGDVRRNIRLLSEIPEERVKLAAKTVYADSFIENLPEGYGTVLGERGAGISHGQQQLLAFARALAFDPRILILDEATANIDSYTESLIQKALQKLLKGRTALVIAHRLSTIKGADRILVLYKGRIVEEGNHETLMKKKGLYYRLYQIQFKKAYEEAEVLEDPGKEI